MEGRGSQWEGMVKGEEPKDDEEEEEGGPTLLPPILMLMCGDHGQDEWKKAELCQVKQRKKDGKKGGKTHRPNIPATIQFSILIYTAATL